MVKRKNKRYGFLRLMTALSLSIDSAVVKPKIIILNKIKTF